MRKSSGESISKFELSWRALFELILLQRLDGGRQTNRRRKSKLASSMWIEQPWMGCAVPEAVKVVGKRASSLEHCCGEASPEAGAMRAAGVTCSIVINRCKLELSLLRASRLEAFPTQSLGQRAFDPSSKRLALS